MLTGKHVILKTVCPKDIESIFNIIEKDEIGCYLSTSYKELALDDMPKFLYTTEPGTLARAFTVFDKKDGSIVGFIGASSIHNVRRNGYIAYLGIKTDIKYRGFGKDAFTLLVKYCFDYLNLHKLIFHTFGDNDRMNMNGIAEYAGWTLEGIQKEYYFTNGKYIDKKIWGLFKRDWKENPIYEHEIYKNM